MGLGIASVVVLLLLYTLLSSNRQAAKRQDMIGVAQKRLSELEEERGNLESQLQDASGLDDEAARQRQIDALKIVYSAINKRQLVLPTCGTLPMRKIAPCPVGACC